MKRPFSQACGLRVHKQHHIAQALGPGPAVDSACRKIDESIEVGNGGRCGRWRGLLREQALRLVGYGRRIAHEAQAVEFCRLRQHELKPCRRLKVLDTDFGYVFQPQR